MAKLAETIKVSSGKPWLLTEEKVYPTKESAKSAANRVIGDNFYPTWEVKYIPVNGTEKGYAVYIRVSENQEYRKKIKGWNLAHDKNNHIIWKTDKEITVGYPGEMFQEWSEKHRTGDTSKINRTVEVYQDGNDYKVMINPLLNKNETHLDVRQVRSKIYVFKSLEKALKESIDFMKKNR